MAQPRAESPLLPRAHLDASLAQRSIEARYLQRRGFWVLVLPAVLVLCLGFINLSRYPETWFDEGSYLLVAQNLADDRSYEARSADGTRDYAPVIGVGPTVLLPVAVALDLTGDSLAGGRGVIVVCLALATALLVASARWLFGERAALFSFGLLLALPALDWLATGRQVLGEVPAVMFLVAGGALAVRRASIPGAAVAGIGLGLAMVTKGQYLLILPLTIVVVAAVDLRWTRVRPWRWHAMIGTAAIATYCAWILSLLLIMGGGQIVENIRLLRESSSGALIIFSPERMRAGVGTLLGPSTFGLVVPALAAGGVAFWRARGERRFALLLLLTFQMLWFMWFAFASIAWPRYAFPALALNAILMGFLFDSALTWCSARYGARLSPQVIRVAATGALTLALVATGVRQLAPLRDGSDAPQRFATRIEPLIPASSSVDGWEPEIDFLIDRPLRYPPLGSLDQVVRARWLDSGDDIEFSDDLTGEFLVVGPFGRWTGVYAPAVESANYELVERVGEYELYRRIAN